MPLTTTQALSGAHAAPRSAGADAAGSGSAGRVEALGMARMYRRNSMSLEEYGGQFDAVERQGPYGRVTTRECRLLQRLLPNAKLPKSCADLSFPASASTGRASAPATARPFVSATSVRSPAAADMATPRKHAASLAISRKECERLADVLLTEINGGGAFLPVSCRRVELQKRRVFEREQERQKIHAQVERSRSKAQPAFRFAGSSVL